MGKDSATIAIAAVEPVERAKPQIALPILKPCKDGAMRKTIGSGEMIERDVSRLRMCRFNREEQKQTTQHEGVSSGVR